jgi:DNA-binding MarR family transcriptional regulator
MNMKTGLGTSHFVLDYLTKVSQILGGATTLNQLRVLAYVSYLAEVAEPRARHRDITAALEISKSTVGRVVEQAVRDGYFTVTPEGNAQRVHGTKKLHDTRTEILTYAAIG